MKGDYLKKSWPKEEELKTYLGKTDRKVAKSFWKGSKGTHERVSGIQSRKDAQMCHTAFEATMLFFWQDKLSGTWEISQQRAKAMTISSAPTGTQI